MKQKSTNKKLEAGNLFNCSDISKFISSIVQVLPFKGVSMSRFYICEYKRVRFLTKLCFYHKTAPELYGKISRKVVSQTDAELNILKIFKCKLIDKNITPCILELVYEKICNGLGKMSPNANICEQLILDYYGYIPEDGVGQLICKYKDLVRANLAHDKCAFLVLEKCDMSLNEYLIKSTDTAVNAAVFKSLLFMIIYTVYAICSIYPGFRHYDLHTDNIMLKFDPNYKFQTTNPKFLIFIINGEIYSVPYFGIIPKIIDFGFSIIPEEGIISNITEDRAQMYYRAENDLLYLFHWIYYVNRNKFERINRLLSLLEPNKSYINYYTKHIRSIENKIPTYEDMIKNSVWDEYRNHKITKNQIYTEFTPLDDVEK